MALSPWCFWLLLLQPLPQAGVAPEGHRVLVLDLISFLMLEGGQRSGGSVLSSFPAGLRWQEDVKSLVRSVLVELESLGILPTFRSSPLRALWQSHGSRSQISGFLYNISTHLEKQELEELGAMPWGSLLQHLLSQPSPNPALQLRDVLISLRGSHDWDMLLSLIHSLLSLFSRDQTLLLFLQQNRARLSSLGEALAQALLTGVLGQGSPGLQGTDCILTGRRNCSSSTDWVSQLLKLFEGTSWKPRVRLQPAGPVLASERFKPFRVVSGAIQELNPNASSLLQLSRTKQPGLDSEGGSADTLWGALEEAKQHFLRRMGRSLYPSFRRKVSRVTGLLVDKISVALGVPQSDREGKCSVGTLQQLLLWGIRHNISWNARTLGFKSRTFLSPPPILSCMQPARKPPQVTKRASGGTWGASWPSAEVLESACNDTIPSLPGISNFTVYLYCSLFNGSDSSSQPPSDLGAACSSSAWYFSSPSGDSMWVRTCREYFPGQFNTTVCSNASLLQLPSPNQPLMEKLCANLSPPPKGDSCLDGLPGAPWSQEDFWSCFLENRTLWTQWLCTNESLQAVPTNSSTWISRLCRSHQLQTKTLNSSLLRNSDPCNFHAWSLQALRNASLVEQCWEVNPARFQELVCENSSFLQSLVSSHHWLMDHCLDSLQNEQCFLQRLLDILPISSHVDASWLCRDPASYLLGLVSQLTHCEEETSRWILSMNYLLHLLDFTLPSSELDEVGQAARDQLSEAILLSSLLDNGSFWALLKVNSSLSILQAVGQYLRQEHDAFFKKELLSCFSPVLWDLIQREEGAPALEVLVQEYLQMPQENFQQLLLSAESEAVQRFLSLLHRSWPRLQVPMSDEQALQSLASRLMGRFPQLTPQLFVDLSQFMPFMAVSDIMRVPPALLANETVLGILACYLSLEELQVLAPLRDPWGPVEQSLLACAANGVLSQHGRVAYALADLLRSANLAAVGPQELHAWRGIFPELGVRFLQRLSATQVRALLPELQAAHLTPAQRLSREQQGWSIWPDSLLPFVPLKLLHLDAATLLGQRGQFWELPWSQQQAQFLWRKVEAGTNVSQDTIRALGTLAAGMGCARLQQFSRRADFLGVLRVLYACPSSLPGSLRWCVWEEVRRRSGLSREELVWLGPKFLVDLPVKLVDKLPNDLVRLILDYVNSHPQSLLVLPPHRRAALAHRALHLLRAPAETEIPGEVLDLLGPLLGFLGQEAAARIQPESLLLHLEMLQGACLAEGFAEELGRLLLTERVLGPPQRWSLLDVQQLGRLVFLLPVESIRLIPREVWSRDTLEQLLQSQQEWEQSKPGRLCQSPGAQESLRSRKEALVAWLVRSSPVGAQDPVPSCADMRTTYPAAWSAAQIASMAPSHFKGCLGLISQDPALSPEQLCAALGKAKQLFGTAQPLQPVHVLQLGLLATQLSMQELQELELSNWGALSVLGVLEGWAARQMRAIVSSFLRQSGMSVQGLALPELAALGHLLCGLRADEMRMLNSQEFSQAAPFVGSLRLGCSERQLETLAELLTSHSAFGPVSSWGPEIFTEIGTLAAGLQDIALSSLIPEQIRALTPLAIAGIPAPKFTVVFSPAQLLGFTSAQASAVTPQQRELLSAQQRQAVASAQVEGQGAQDGRGRNHARCHPGPSALALLCLMYSFG
ncbi:stereocilin [Chelonoidis abingdonii]|uniref:stereocilin n=1 Tax=Chelonoidis abingdonii TaxID=106734 RepID=UPI003F49A588